MTNSVLTIVRKMTSILLLAACCHFAGAQNAPTTPGQASLLVFEAKPVKGVYTQGDTVEVDFRLTNKGKDEAIVPRALRLSLSVELEISGDSGQRAEWCGRVADEVIPSKARYRSLSPGESIGARLAVSCVNSENPSQAWGYFLNEPGKYIIKPSYRLPQSKGFFESLFPKQQVPRGPVLAEPITIRIR